MDGPKAQKNYDNFEQQKLTISLLNTISIRPETQRKKLQRQETEHTSVKSFWWLVGCNVSLHQFSSKVLTQFSLF